MSLYPYTVTEVQAMKARLAKLEDAALQFKDDETWARKNAVLVEFAPTGGGWNAGMWRGKKYFSGFSHNLADALRQLRSDFEGGAR